MQLNIISLRFLGLFVTLFMVSACSQTTQGDPLEPLNREIHAFNKGFDKIALKPISNAYASVTPEPIRSSIDAFSENLAMPGYVINDLLQLKLQAATENSFRFLVNTTFGIGGLFDPATDMGLRKQPTNFGKTLEAWGVKKGAYLELPFLGPSTTRQAFGTIVDAMAFSFPPHPDKEMKQASTTSRVLKGLNLRYENSGQIDSLYGMSVDSYAQLRQIYLARLDRDIRRTKNSTGDPYADFLD